MLKLEWKHKNNELRILPRERHFNRILLAAFTFALFLHLAAFLLFSIAPVSWRTQFERPLQSFVQAEYTPGQTAFSSINSLDLPMRFAPEPPKADFKPEDIPAFFSTLKFDPVESKLPVPFSHVEERMLDSIIDVPLLVRATQERSKSKPLISCALHGNLAGWEIDEKCLQEWIPPATRTLDGDYRVVLALKIHRETGRVFWYKIEQSSGHKLLDSEVEELLSGAKFTSKDSRSFIASGLAEFSFHLVKR